MQLDNRLKKLFEIWQSNITLIQIKEIKKSSSKLIKHTKFYPLNPLREIMMMPENSLIPTLTLQDFELNNQLKIDIMIIKALIEDTADRLAGKIVIFEKKQYGIFFASSKNSL